MKLATLLIVLSCAGNSYAMTQEASKEQCISLSRGAMAGRLAWSRAFKETRKAARVHLGIKCNNAYGTLNFDRLESHCSEVYTKNGFACVNCRSVAFGTCEY